MNQKNTNFLLLLVLLFFYTENKGADCYFLPQSGNWSDPNNWSCGQIPTNDTAIIASGQTVTVSGQNPYNMNYEWYCSKLILQDGTIQSVTGTNNAGLRVWGDADLYGGLFSYISVWIEGITIFKPLAPSCFLINGSTLYLLDDTYQYSSISLQHSSAIRNYATYHTSTSFTGTVNNNGYFYNHGTYKKQGISTQQFYIRFINELNGECIIENGSIRNASGAGSFINKNIIRIYENAKLEINNTGLALNVGSLVTGKGRLIINNSFSGGGGAGTTTVECKMTINGSCSLNGNIFLMKDSVTWLSGLLNDQNGFFQIAPSSVLTIDFSGTQSLSSNLNNYGQLIAKAGTLSCVGNYQINNHGTWVVLNGFTHSGNSQSMFNNYGLFTVDSGIVTMGMRITNHASGALGGNGRINFTNVFTNNGSINPGNSAGVLKLDLAGTTTLTTQRVEIDIFNNTGGGTGHDSLVTVDNIILNGTLQVKEMGCTQPGTFSIIYCESNNNCLSGTFSNLELPANYSIQYTSNRVLLTKSQTNCQHMVCNPLDHGDGSLRVAIDCAADGYTINFHTSLDGDTIYLTSKELFIDKNLTIDAGNLNHIVINASAVSRAFRIFPGNQVELRDLDIIGGNSLQGSSLLNEGNLGLHNIIMKDPLGPDKSQVYTSNDITLTGVSMILPY